ncbi:MULTISPECIES: hypothetical protein [unclassified Beijerinckia]|uniref:hypothetical protein n=1 Tax=unclassified Beijerinckia TaxID=2638183 RepID=UPI00089AFA6B|nr:MULTISPECIES: hypothetical protein [unclassified Beijerinckia]MDH7797258.1 hypothetical protein [Beijerinckia sp. GAS462]SEC78347.1 hypothetical protein SAMN05443249_3551 [Beijerinckia sp. 28-YEA-48]
MALADNPQIGKAQLAPGPGLVPEPAAFSYGGVLSSPMQSFALNGHFVALLACLIAALLAHAGAMPTGFQWLGRLSAFLEPFAWPAYLAFSGIACHGFLQTKWQVTSRDYIEPAVIYGALWVTLNAATSYVSGFAPLAPIAASLHATIGIWEIPALLALPAFMLIAQRFFGGRRLLLLIAAMALHVLAPRTGFAFIDLGLSGFIYFVIGTLYARQGRALATWASRHPALAIVILCVWSIYNALATFYPAATLTATLANLPFASLPLAKFGLALVGIGAVAMVSGLLGLLQSVLSTIAAEPRIAHLWRPVVLLVPFAIGTLCGVLVATRLAPSHAGALAVLSVMSLTAIVTVALVRVFGLAQTTPHQEAAATAKLRPIRQLNDGNAP